MLLKKISTLLMIGGLFAITTEATASIPMGAKFSIGADASRVKSLGETGWLVGINASAGYHFQNQIFINTQLRSNTGRIKKADASNFDLRALFGINIPADNCVTFSPFIGLGYNTFSAKARYYKITTDLLYIPMGAMATVAMSRQSQLEFTAEYDLQIDGEFDAKSRNTLISRRTKRDISPGKFNGFRGEAMFVNKFTPQSSVAFGPYVNTWQSRKHYGNTTGKYTEVGVKVAYRFY